ncbi:DUF5134 domain-containing protein [Streptomyces sp. NPDC058417]|uniref:DUF5134 domain-containing protein n=1 Tax=unclassified Streptomyces TaxID=2593676 RepID=UPI003666F988
MIAASGLRWILSLLFAVPAGYGLWMLARPGTAWAERLDHVVHAAMGGLMLAMAWPWGMDLPAGPQIVLFAVGAAWFVAAAPLRAEGAGRGGAVVAALPHTVMAAAMAWMVWAMSAGDAMHGGAGAGGAHEMAGHHMAADGGLAAMTLTGTGTVATAVVLAVVVGVFGLVWLSRALDRARGPQEGDGTAGAGAATYGAPVGVLAPACHAAMALGMAVMFAVMA